MANLDWVQRERLVLGGKSGGAKIPTVDLVSAQSAHEAGYLTARRVRSELLGMSSESPVPDLVSVLENRLGWARGCSKMAAGETRLDGMVGIDTTRSAPLLVVSDTRSVQNERFRMARAAFFPVTRNLGDGARLLTGSVTPPQRAARAFAAEFLAPSEALKQRVSGRVGAQDLDSLAEEYLVSPLVILHQIENHGLGYVEP